MADRLEAIEIKLAHLERAVAEISDVVARQQKELDRALDRNQRLMEKIAAHRNRNQAPARRRTKSRRTTERSASAVSQLRGAIDSTSSWKNCPSNGAGAGGIQSITRCW